MEQSKARENLAKAERLSATSGTTAARWYVRYLVVYGLASFGIAAAYAFVDNGKLATVITMPIWIVIIIGLSVWSARQRTAVRGFGLIHGVVIGVWGAAWALTIGLGSTVFLGVWQWFIAGGIVMAGAAFTGAYVTHRRSRG